MTSLLSEIKNIVILHFNYSKIFGCVGNRTQETKTLLLKRRVT